MLETIINYVASLDHTYIYIALFFFAFIENVFPPSPSDVVVVFGATLITSSSQGISYIAVLALTSIGSSLGFMVMYYVGEFFGERVIRAGKVKFITPELISKIDVWFEKYGYKLIAVNRFLPGTRSAISFFAGFSELKTLKTFFYATISAFLWNLLIIYFGMQVGNNIQLIDFYLKTYSNIVIALTSIIVLVFVLKYFLPKLRNKK